MLWNEQSGRSSTRRMTLGTDNGWRLWPRALPQAINTLSMTGSAKTTRGNITVSPTPITLNTRHVK